MWTVLILPLFRLESVGDLPVRLGVVCSICVCLMLRIVLAHVAGRVAWMSLGVCLLERCVCGAMIASCICCMFIIGAAACFRLRECLACARAICKLI